MAGGIVLEIDGSYFASNSAHGEFMGKYDTGASARGAPAAPRDLCHYSLARFVGSAHDL